MLGDFLAHLRRHTFLRRIALFLPTIVLVLVSLELQEFYPISHNPMYSGLGGSTTAFYVTDQNDEVLPFADAFGESLIMFMKVMRTTEKRIRKARGKKNKRPRVEAQREAAPEVLAFFLQNRRSTVADRKIDATSLKVWVVETTRVGKKLEKQTSLLCETPVPEDLRATAGGGGVR